MSSIQAFATGVIFPTNKEVNDKFEYSHPLSEDNKIYRFYAFPVTVPYTENSSYELWNKVFQENTDKTIAKMFVFMDKEREYYERVKEIVGKLEEIRGSF